MPSINWNMIMGDKRLKTLHVLFNTSLALDTKDLSNKVLVRLTLKNLRQGKSYLQQYMNCFGLFSNVLEP